MSSEYVILVHVASAANLGGPRREFIKETRKKENKRKQKNKNSTKKVIKKKRKFFLSSLSFSWSSSCFVVFFYKLPPLEGGLSDGMWKEGVSVMEMLSLVSAL